MTDFDKVIFEKIGKLTYEIRDEVSKIPKEGSSMLEVIEYVEKKIFDEGYLPAFPCTVCINEIAAHFTVFEEDYEFKKGDVVKIDFGISHNGFITDNAFTVEIGTNEHKDLLEANFKALNDVMDMVEVGVTMSQIGEVVDNVAQKGGFKTIHNLSGHEIKVNELHAGLHVPNYKNSDLGKVEVGMELAIEPFFTYGDPKIKSEGFSNILHLTSDSPVRDAIAKKVLKYIREKFPLLPFSKRWLLDEFDKRKVLYALRVLKAHGIILEYETLVSTNGAIISQFEDTVIFFENEKRIITREN